MVGGGACWSLPRRDHNGGSPWDRQAVMGACDEGVDDPEWADRSYPEFLGAPPSGRFCRLGSGGKLCILWAKWCHSTKSTVTANTCIRIHINGIYSNYFVSKFCVLTFVILLFTFNIHLNIREAHKFRNLTIVHSDWNFVPSSHWLLKIHIQTQYTPEIIRKKLYAQYALLSIYVKTGHT